MSIDNTDDQIAYLTMDPEGMDPPDEGVNINLAGEQDQGEKSTFDGPDTILDEPLETPGMPKRILGSEEPEPQKDAQLPADAKTDKGDEAQPEEWQVKLAEAERAAAGRLDEVATLRSRLRTQDDSIEELRKLMLAQMEREEAYTVADELEDDAQLYGKEVVTDPHMRYVRDKIAGIEENIEQQRQRDEHYRRELTAQAEQVQQQRQAELAMMNALGQQEAAFAEKYPDYDKAYKFTRSKKLEMMVGRGYTEKQAIDHINAQEAQLAQEQLYRGGNVAEQVWAEAQAYGYQSPQAQEKPAVNQQVQSETVADIDRIKAGLANQGLATMQGAGADRGDPQYMTNEEFFSKVPAGLRQQIFMNPDKFEEIAKTGRIRVDW
jgi:hypothetical protein